MVTFSESTAADFDSARLKYGTHDEQASGTDWAPDDQVEKGYRTDVQGLIAYYPFDEDSGTTANEVTGTSTNGTYNVTALGAAGVLGTTCPDFEQDNSDDIDLGSNIIDGNSDFTLSVWFNAESIGEGGGDDIVLSHAIGSSTNYYLYFDNDGILKCYNTFGKLNIVDGLTTSTWYHAVVSYDASAETVDAWVNATQETDGASFSFSDGSADGNNRVGSHADGRYWDGRIDELLLLNRTTTDSEVQELYDTVAGTSEYWADVKTS